MVTLGSDLHYRSYFRGRVRIWQWQSGVIVQGQRGVGGGGPGAWSLRLEMAPFGC